MSTQRVAELDVLLPRALAHVGNPLAEPFDRIDDVNGGVHVVTDGQQELGLLRQFGEGACRARILTYLERLLERLPADSEL